MYQLCCLLFYVIFFLTSTAQCEQRIVGGSGANIEDYPYQVSLLYMNKSHMCGGSIMNHHWILTAAHCLDGMKASDITVLTGTSFWAEGGDRYSVERLVMHSAYTTTPSRHDIGLIRVSDEIRYGPAVQPIKLFTSRVSPNTNVKLTGWGKTSHPGKPSDNLQQIDLKTVDLTECRVDHIPLSLLDQPNTGNICAIGKKSTGACHGDSGGPLVKDDVQVGVVSWGRPCAKNVPDVYTAVYPYIDWIGKNTKD